MSEPDPHIRVVIQAAAKKQEKTVLDDAPFELRVYAVFCLIFPVIVLTQGINTYSLQFNKTSMREK